MRVLSAVSFLPMRVLSASMRVFLPDACPFCLSAFLPFCRVSFLPIGESSGAEAVMCPDKIF